MENIKENEGLVRNVEKKRKMAYMNVTVVATGMRMRKKEWVVGLAALKLYSV